MTLKTYAKNRNRRGKKDARNDTSEALDNPNLTRSKDPSEEGYYATLPQIMEDLGPQPFQGDEGHLWLHLTKAIASNAGLPSPMMVSTPMLGGDALLILFGRNDENNGATQTQLEEDMPRGMSALTHDAHWQEKKLEWLATKHPYAWWKNILLRVQASGPGAGYTMNNWNMMVQWLRTVPCIEGTRTLVEKARGLLPPMGYAEWEWKVFLNQAEVKMVRGNDIVVEGTSLIEVKQKSIPPTLDTLKRAEESLMMPRQPEESSSEAELWYRALERLRNTSKMSNSSTSSSSGETLDCRNVRNIPMERASH